MHAQSFTFKHAYAQSIIFKHAWGTKNIDTENFDICHTFTEILQNSTLPEKLFSFAKSNDEVIKRLKETTSDKHCKKCYRLFTDKFTHYIKDIAWVN